MEQDEDVKDHLEGLLYKTKIEYNTHKLVLQLYEEILNTQNKEKSTEVNMQSHDETMLLCSERKCKRQLQKYCEDVFMGLKSIFDYDISDTKDEDCNANKCYSGHILKIDNDVFKLNTKLINSRNEYLTYLQEHIELLRKVEKIRIKATPVICKEHINANESALQLIIERHKYLDNYIYEEYANEPLLDSGLNKFLLYINKSIENCENKLKHQN